MKIMLCNDDGVFALGIRTLATHLREAGHELIIVAPDRERSAASHSITLRRDVRMKKLQPNEYSVDGTPVTAHVIDKNEQLAHGPAGLALQLPNEFVEVFHVPLAKFVHQGAQQPRRCL